MIYGSVQGDNMGMNHPVPSEGSWIGVCVVRKTGKKPSPGLRPAHLSYMEYIKDP